MRKKMNLAAWLLGAAMIAFTACSDDNENNGNNNGNIIPENLPKPVANVFTKQFPDAVNVKWTEKKNYYVATFDLKKGKTRADTAPAPQCEAWYTQEGQCSLSEKEISKEDFKTQYTKVWDAYNKSTYNTEGYILDDIDLLQRNLSETGEAEIIIKLEVEKKDAEYELYYTTEGILVKEVPDNDENDEDENLPCPQKLVSYIAKNYKDAIIVDFEEEKNETTKALEYEVEILRSAKIENLSINIEYELLFDKDYKFLGSEIDLDDLIKVAFIQMFVKKLPQEKLDELIALTGEKDPSKWEIEIRENTKHEIEIYTEVETAEDKEELVLIATINPADFGL
ncbi:hypothetical protein [Bacteroides sp. AM10-21B]|uniref:hypothetical protein n=1 Tax=Bacteroides sp. AM10-21B TaxID=2292001 RepID=UPI000E4F2883|nr:hypothetical protein [Bacteroides sp. AM10-21B]RHJ49052.1 hypothetical protein DW121_13650 [Bacteroides sp. AM10-21B]